MKSSVSSVVLFEALLQPKSIFTRLAQTTPSAADIFLKHTLWLLLLPPLFALVGGYGFGWRLGADEPLRLPLDTLIIISIAYFVLLVFGFVTTAIISRWMAATYGANSELGLHAAIITIVGEPLALASVSHIYPDVFFNVLVLIPAAIWSMYLLYAALPVVLEIPPERGVLMASSLLGWLLVAAVSLLGLTVGLWTAGFGPALGV